MISLKRNKKGQFFALYLVLVTLVMCGIVIWIYSVQSKALASSMISPAKVLAVQDDFEFFETWENQTLIFSADETLKTNEWKTSEFITNIESLYCKNFSEQNSFFGAFLFKDLYYLGKENSGEVFTDVTSRLNFCKDVYSFSFEGDNLKVLRAELEKKFRIIADDRGIPNFPVNVAYKFDKQYLITKEAIN